MEGVVVARDTVARGDVRLRVGATGLEIGARVAVSIRPHEIALRAPDAGGGGSETNELRGAVRRAAFLGDGVDYEVEVAGSDFVLRVAAPTSPRLRPGEAVGLRIAPGACVLLADDAEQA